MTIRRLFVVGILASVSIGSVVQGETWPAFRGMAGRGVSTETNLPTEWSVDKNVAWTTDLPGRGNSSPAVTSSRIYVTTQTEDKSLWVIAIDRKQGNMPWKKNVGSGTLVAFGPKSQYTHRHNPATPSPVADEEHVWAFFGTGLLVCLDKTGEVTWKRDLVKDYGAYKIRFGMGSSPRLWGDLIYQACMHNGPSYVVALDKQTGKEVWKAPRDLPAKDDGPQAYSTPVVLQTGARDELVVVGSDRVNAYDLLTGKQLWICDGLTVDSTWARIVASPAVSAEAVVVCSANPPGTGKDHMMAVRTGGSGDITKTHKLWEHRPFNPDCPTPVCYEGKLYMVRDDGVASCLDLKTGHVHWKQRLSGGTYWPSVVAGDKKLYFLNLDGQCTVVQSGTEAKILARNSLEDTFFATPAISDGFIYLRGHKKLYAVGGKK